jgi:diguanylate cyclase (GGDEF)-like protein
LPKLIVDDLTGLYRRNEGFAELAREMARAKRTVTPLVAAFVDVDGLKAINDSRGHAAGDAMLVAVARSLQFELRNYDVIFRYGGDEIVCALPGIDRAEAARRFVAVRAALIADPAHGSISVGLAQMRREDSAHDLVARADKDLYIRRRRQRGPRNPG